MFEFSEKHTQNELKNSIVCHKNSWDKYFSMNVNFPETSRKPNIHRNSLYVIGKNPYMSNTNV